MSTATEVASSSPAASSETEEIVVNSVAEFVAELDQLDREEGTETFYRGQADKDWKLIPSIFRTPDGPKVEHLLFRDMVAHEPQSFSECQSALDHLVQMQHYGLPTRLLDVSMNPLVALYMACVPDATDPLKKSFDVGFEAGSVAGWDAGSGAVDPEFDLDPSEAMEEGRWVGGITGMIAATMTARFSDGCQPIVKDVVEAIASASDKPGGKEGAVAGARAGADAVKVPGVVYLFSIPKDQVKHYDSDTVSVLANLAKCQITEDCPAPSSGEEFNAQPCIKELICQIRGEKPYFSPSVKVEDLNRILLVKPRNGNQRIINQMGAFFLFGLVLKEGIEVPFGDSVASLSKKGDLVVPNEWIKRKFIIPSDKKDTIRRGLANLGIVDSYIYPGIEWYAKELKQRYKF